MSSAEKPKSFSCRSSSTELEIQVLSDAGIVPSNSATYTSDEIISAISASFGEDPVLLCDDDTLYQMYYGFYVTGALTDENFVPAPIVGEDTTCPDSGIKYPVKSGATAVSTTATATATTTSRRKTTTTTGTSATATATGTSVSGAGSWNTYYKGSVDGCLISAGTWYIGGTCATYHATATSTLIFAYTRFTFSTQMLTTLF